MANTPNLTDTMLKPVLVSDLSGNDTIVGALNSKNVADFYKISLTSASVLDINLTAENLNTSSAKYGNSVFYIYSTTGRLYSTSSTARNTSKDLTTVLPANDYIIKVQSGNSSTLQDYALNLMATPVEDEAGNSIAEANSSVFVGDFANQTVEVSGKIGGYNQMTGIVDFSDYYQFSLSASSKIDVMNNTPSVRFSFVNENNQIVSPTALTSGTYYFVPYATSAIANKLKPDFTDYRFSLKASPVAIPEITYSATAFNESDSNNGTIKDTIIATLKNDIFKGSIGSILSLSASGVPAGLKIQAIKTSDTTATISLIGTARYHASKNNTQNLSLSFGNTAFGKGIASDVVNVKLSGIGVNFIDKSSTSGSLTFSSSAFTETSANDGSLNKIVATLNSDSITFTGNIGSSLEISATATALPAGMTSIRAIKTSDTTASIEFVGSATAHQQSNSDSAFKIAFGNSAFSNNNASLVSNSEKLMPISFSNNIRSLAFQNTTLTENLTNNDGSIDGSITISLTGDTFVGEVGSLLPLTASNVPTGLTAVAQKVDDSTATVIFTGNAENHLKANSVSNITLVFGDNAFSQKNALLVGNNSIAKTFGINFLDDKGLSYSSDAFTETTTNAGTTNSIIVTLSGDTFTGSIGTKLPITATNLPAGFTSLSATKLSSTMASLSLNGSATLHQAGHSISDLNFAFNDSAFTSGSASLVANSDKLFSVNFNNNTRQLSYNATTFNESLTNDGSISNSITVSLLEGSNTPNGDAFVADSTGTIPITIQNLPNGLTATATIGLSTNQAVIKLQGNAINHNALNSIQDIHINFDDSAFKQGYANLIINNTLSKNFTIAFKDAPTLSYASTTFNESTSNDGSIGNSIIVTLADDIFSGTANSALAIDTANVPSGLTVSAKQIDSTHAELTITGNATAHANSNDISNMTVTFKDGDFKNTSLAENVKNSTAMFNIDFSDAVASNLVDPDNNSTETASAISSLGLINSYGKSATSTLGAVATSSTYADQTDYYQFNLAYKGNVFADNPNEAIHVSVKDANGEYIPISATNGTELSAGTHTLKIDTTSLTASTNYSIKLRAVSSPSGSEVVVAPSGSKNLISPYLTNGYYAVLDFGGNQNLNPLKWNSAGISVMPSTVTQSVSKALQPVEIIEQGGHVRSIVTTRSQLFPVDPTQPTISYIPMYNDANGTLIINYSYSISKNVDANGTSQNATDGSLSLLNSTQKTAIRQAFDEWEKLVNVKFVDVTNTASDTYNKVHMFIGNVSAGTNAGFAAYIRNWNDGAGNLLKTDFWINSSSTTSSTTTPAVGNYGYLTYLHEIGHALGLKHPGDYYNGGEHGPFLVSELDTHQYSIMSYNRGTQTANYFGTDYNIEQYGGGFPITPATIEVSAIQSLYTPNTTSTAGDTKYSWNTYQNAYQTIYDASGVDTIDTSNQGLSQTINLNSGEFSSIGAVTLSGSSTPLKANNNMTIAYQTVIENAIGGKTGDTIIGNSVDNVIDGKESNDTLTGGNGNNTFVFSTTPNSTTNADIITDFKLGDRINLSLSVYPALSGGTVGSELISAQYSDSTLKTATTRIYADRSVSNQVSLYYDSDGSGSAGAVKFATLSNFTSALSSNNFGIIA